jgi:hypothetical protein
MQPKVGSSEQLGIVLWRTKYGGNFLRTLVGKRLIKYTDVKKASTQ